ncbi:hypothetical protein EYZ11_011517 [Aspergillus tanneri]|uniref:Uncharacterized protein n=1 Tax=Aspergillus tanneri TaxID=1220188 RepID=A0A4S3J380_9EURO|nr:hypothetical protein EYZ11_011517 [Aspergillus tanneri]
MPPGLIDMFELFNRVRAELVRIMKVKECRAPRKNTVSQGGKESVYKSVLDNPNLPLLKRPSSG